MVRAAGLEPARHMTQDFKSRASTYSATLALFEYYSLCREQSQAGSKEILSPNLAAVS